MAKIDVSKIEGYEAMTPEDKLNALLGYEFEEPKPAEPTDSARLKEALSKANSEAAAYKRQLREKQTEAERAEADRAEAEQKLQEELAGYKQRERLSNYRTQLMSAGVDAETAKLMAEALPDGVSDDYFATVKAFNENQKQAIVSEALNNQPGLSVGTPPKGRTAEELEMETLRRNIGLI